MKNSKAGIVLTVALALVLPALAQNSVPMLVNYGGVLRDAKSEPLTLGVEFELALIDKTTLKPAHQGAEIVEEANRPTFHKEGLQHMVEVTTTVCRNAQEAEKQMDENVKLAIDLADKKGLLVTGTGRPPTIKLSDCKRVDDPRYNYQYESRKIGGST